MYSLYIQFWDDMSEPLLLSTDKQKLQEVVAALSAKRRFRPKWLDEKIWLQLKHESKRLGSFQVSSNSATIV